MDLKIFSAKDFSTKMKCTIHASGKLGFTEAAAMKMRLSDDSGIKFGVDEEGDGTIYLIHTKDNDEDSFKANKAGTYYYVNTKSLFDTLKFDYVNNNIIFDMVEIREGGIEMYKLIKRSSPRKKNERESK